MPYVDPMDTYSDGDLVPTADINQWIGNIDFLHSRPITLYQQGISSGSLAILGDFAARQIANTGAANAETVFQLPIPDNFLIGNLISAQIDIVSTTSYTAEYDVNTDYGAPDVAESYNAHSGTIPNTTIALTANQAKWIDISSAITSLAAGDVLGVRISNTTGANAGNWHSRVLKIVYTPSDSVP